MYYLRFGGGSSGGQKKLEAALQGKSRTNRKRLLTLSLLFLLAAACPSCGSWIPNSAVQVVRNGVLDKYTTTTVGKAFEGTFQDARWTSFVSPKGVTVVQFDGTIVWGRRPDAHKPVGDLAPAEILRNCVSSLDSPGTWADLDPINRMADCAIDRPMPVRFQFLVSADRKTFEIGSVDENFGTVERALAFIYN